MQVNVRRPACMAVPDYVRRLAAAGQRLLCVVGNLERRGSGRLRLDLLARDGACAQAVAAVDDVAEVLPEGVEPVVGQEPQGPQIEADHLRPRPRPHCLRCRNRMVCWAHHSAQSPAGIWDRSFGCCIKAPYAAGMVGKDGCYGKAAQCSPSVWAG